MKYAILIILFFSPYLSISQEKADSDSIDVIVNEIDRLSKAHSRSYTRNVTINHRKVKEQWTHFDNKQLGRITIKYSIDSTEYTEEYYLKDGVLIYAYEGERWYSPHHGGIEQGTAWSGGFYFSKEKLIDHVTLGHGKSETDDWDPEKEILKRLKKRKAESKLLK